MKVLYVYADKPEEWNCSRWNCIIGSNSINNLPNHESIVLSIKEFIKNEKKSQNLCLGADIIVVERNFFSDALTVMQYWKVRNKTILAIFDDAYDLIEKNNPSYNFWKEGTVNAKNKKTGEVKKALMKPHPMDQFKWALKIAKGIQVPSVNLAKDWSKYNNTYYIHNFLDMDTYLNVEPLYPHPKEEIYIGWCGSMSHHYSFENSGVVRALKIIAKRYPQVKVLISGDKRLFDMIDVENKMFSKFVPPKKWTSLLKSLDIGLAPLSGEYDKRRSWIKTLEYMALKVPWIATNYITYDEVKDYGIMTENGVYNWVNSITDMIENYDCYKKIADTEGFEFAKKQSSYEKVKTITIPFYEKLINMPYSNFPNENTKAYLDVEKLVLDK